MRKTVACNEKGYPIGEDHHRARRSDAEVELVHKLRAEGLTVREIAIKMEIGAATVHGYLSGRLRAHIAARFRVVHISEE